jgi:hypothetical protein
MNGMLAVGSDSDYAESGGATGRSIFSSALAFVGLLLLIAALRLVLKWRGPHPNAAVTRNVSARE